jgi:hypothetical protein
LTLVRQRPFPVTRRPSARAHCHSQTKQTRTKERHRLQLTRGNLVPDLRKRPAFVVGDIARVVMAVVRLAVCRDFRNADSYMVRS